MASILHVAVLAFPFGTHAAPLFALLRKLARSAPGTRFSFFNTANSNRSICIDQQENENNVHVYQVWDGMPDDRPFEGTHLEEIGLFLRASPANFDKAIIEVERDTGLEIGCLISDAFLWFASDLAESRNIPWVSFWTAASCSLSVHVYTSEIVDSVRSAAAEDQLLQFIPPGLPSRLKITDLPSEIFLEENPSPLAITINSMVEKLPQSAAVVLNSFEAIDPIITQDLKLKFKHFLNVGPQILSNLTPQARDDKTGCLSWLDKQTRPRSVVYISFGTVIVPPKNELLALAEALEACQLPFLWSMRGATNLLPEGFLERSKELGKVVAWAPQVRILGHDNVGAFVTHCGWNSILESITRGVPMICRPFFGDQKINSVMVEESWKIGVRVDGGVLTKAGTIKGLDRVMCSKEGKVIRENVMELKQKAMDAVGTQGSSTKNFKTLLDLVLGGE